jgi:hypothetical protein
VSPFLPADLGETFQESDGGMGGFGSGQWQNGKALTTQHKRLDVGRVQRPAKGHGTDFQRWNDGAGVWLLFRPLSAEVEMRLPGQPTQRHTIELDTTPLHYGGHRVWWKCPCCRARVGMLYWQNWRWQCRQCAGLAYKSTRQSEDSQAFGRVNKIRDKLGWGGGLASPMGGRPKGMHWKTYARLMQELVDASVAASGASSVVMDRQMERLKKIRIPT